MNSVLAGLSYSRREAYEFAMSATQHSSPYVEWRFVGLNTQTRLKTSEVLNAPRHSRKSAMHASVSDPITYSHGSARVF